MKSLPERMREAATVLEEVTRQGFPASDALDQCSWNAFELRDYAIRWERGDREKAEQDALAEELAVAIARLGGDDDVCLARNLLSEFDIRPKARS